MLRKENITIGHFVQIKICYPDTIHHIAELVTVKISLPVVRQLGNSISKFFKVTLSQHSTPFGHWGLMCHINIYVDFGAIYIICVFLLIICFL